MCQTEQKGTLTVVAEENVKKTKKVYEHYTGFVQICQNEQEGALTVVATENVKSV